MHLIRNACKYVSWKDREALCVDLKQVYTSATAREAEQELQVFADKWDDKYPVISKSWRTHWPNINTLFDYPDEIRKVIYTTNAIESLNSQIRKAIKNRRIFPNDNSAMKLIKLHPLLLTTNS